MSYFSVFYGEQLIYALSSNVPSVFPTGQRLFHAKHSIEIYTSPPLGWSTVRHLRSCLLFADGDKLKSWILQRFIISIISHKICFEYMKAIH